MARALASSAQGSRRLLAQSYAGGDIDEHGNDGDDETGGSAASKTNSTEAGSSTPPYLLDGNIILLDKLWEMDKAAGLKCRQTNVLFKFVDGDFNDMSYHQQIKLIFNTGVAANNVFRNMAAGVGNFYEDVLYEGVDVNVDELKAAVKRAMDFVARKVMEARQRQSGAPRLVLDDQTHFSLVAPSHEQCPMH
ncbi:hypothetical protein GPECTOR_33g669 [Gonium pectorale]|uniref:Uncharacterized protein n=1 Tax=Gonium pectorale TaxID=33097 RepID=A0A150GD64_GONPE|nr:hypothetical protein GPECTOR_33g669 [Gonium pectorale]|eukprot:KXZ47787.1 hypothetical protein GPECTOR_33g669 [Gonium pectorale]